MAPDRLPEDPRPHENPWIVFLVVAAVMLGTLIVISRVVAAETSASRFIAAVTPRATDQFGGLGPMPLVQDSIAAPAEPTFIPAAEPTAEPVVETTATPPESAPTVVEPQPEPPPPAPEPPPQPEPPPPPPPQPPAPRIRAPPPALNARAAIVMERACGAVVWGMNEREKLPPASTTKIISSLVAIEAADLNAVVTASVSASHLARTTGSSTMGLEPGMRVTIQDLIYGLMLPSGNDAALQIAYHIAGGVPGFVALMNLKAQQIGMRDTNFTNPHGLDDPGIFSTAYDMALAGRAYLDNDLLARIAVTPVWNTLAGARLTNGNRLLGMYPGSYGVKIGFTLAAKQTFVGAAERNGRHVIITLFGTEDRYGDAVKLLDWALAHTEPAC